MSRLVLSSLALLALVGAGCTRNAALEVELGLPAAASGATQFAVIQVSRPRPFEVLWGDADDLEPVNLTAAPQTFGFSVMATDVSTDLAIKVRFCEAADCQTLGSPGDPAAEVWLELETPMFVGERTFFHHEIPAVPSDAIAPPAGCIDETASPGDPVIPEERPTWYCPIDKCMIEGCVQGMPSFYCDGELHFCE